jgi:hypothetical protein
MFLKDFFLFSPRHFSFMLITGDQQPRENCIINLHAKNLHPLLGRCNLLKPSFSWLLSGAQAPVNFLSYLW